ncbi:14547_t:CDS:2, partial [Rhizophagus irregularis]
GQWKKCKKENIVRVWPHPSSYRNGDQWKAYCRVKVLLHVRHRKTQNALNSGILDGREVDIDSIDYW